MKKFVLSSVIIGATVLSMSSQSIVELNLAKNQNPIFEISTNEVSLAFPGNEDFLVIGADIVIKGGSGEYSFRWYNEQGEELGNEKTLEITLPGIYRADISDTCDCLQTVTFDISEASVYDIKPEKFFISPNPTNGLIKIYGIDAVQLTAVDSAGKLVFIADHEGDIFNEADLSGLTPGLYFISVKDIYGNLFTDRIIKK